MTDFAGTSPLSPVPVERFAHAWANGRFRDGTYYVLRPETGFPASAYGEAFEIIEVPDTDTGTAPVLVHGFTLYVYSDSKLAEDRARQIGASLLVVGDLLAFCNQASAECAFVDLILDEQWHAELYACRESNHQGVTHIRISAGYDLFECTRCANTEICDWTPYHSYGNPNHEREFCRPVPFPFDDHLASVRSGGKQGRRNQIEPDQVRFYDVDDTNVVVIESAIASCPGAGRTYTAFVSPIREFAFPAVPADDLLLLRGEGVWVPIADWTRESGWVARPWCGLTDSGPFVKELTSVTEDGATLNLCRGPNWYLNHAYAELERGLRLFDEGRDGSRAIAEGKRLAAAAVAVYPRNRHLNELSSTLTRFDSTDGARGIVHADRAGWQLFAGRSREVFTEAERAIRLLPELALPHYVKGLVFARKETADVLEFYFDEVLRLEPEYAPAFCNLGLVSRWHGDHAAAKRCFERAAELGTEPELALFRLAEFCHHAGDLDGCDELCDRALESNEDFPDALWLKAQLCVERGELEEALAIGLRLLRADPLCAEAYRSAATLACKLGRIEILEHVADIARCHAPWVRLPRVVFAGACEPRAVAHSGSHSQQAAQRGDRGLGQIDSRGGRPA